MVRFKDVIAIFTFIKIQQHGHNILFSHNVTGQIVNFTPMAFSSKCSLYNRSIIEFEYKKWGLRNLSEELIVYPQLIAA